jgi:4-hydroxy-2-oxoheptanedioate aldolase
MFGIERPLLNQLLHLKQAYGLVAIKAEFEAEGASFNDLVRLRRLTCMAGVPLRLKIGGVEAMRDIKDALELGVDGIVAPMVESVFGLRKFLEGYRKIYGDHRIHLAINIETKNSIDQLDAIMKEAEGKIDGITLGRTDLSASWLDPAITPDTDFVMALIEYAGKKCLEHGLSFTVGGSISATSIERFFLFPASLQPIRSIETRKVILPRDTLLTMPDALNEALRFEELWILSKKEFSDTLMKDELERLDKLTKRAVPQNAPMQGVAAPLPVRHDIRSK